MDSSSVLQEEMGMNRSLENMMVCTKSQHDKKQKPPQEHALKCPRCDSINTKFCYYNNYSLTQPRYFCKGCRRYWTKGGTLRNVPVGGGCRKNKRASSSKRGIQDHHQPLMIMNTHNSPLSNNLHYDCNDLSLAFSRLQKQSNGHDHQLSILGNLNNNNNTHYDIFGNSNSNLNHGFVDAFRANFQENSNGNFQNLYYSGGFGNNGKMMGDEVENTCDQPMAQYDDEISDANVKNGNTRVLWGYPWQIGGTYNHSIDYHDHDHDQDQDHPLELGRESWNTSGSIAPSWHGLLNSPLM